MTQYASWPSVFFMNVPLALVVAVTRSVMPVGMTRRGSVDLISAVTVTAGLAAVVFAWSVHRRQPLMVGMVGMVGVGMVGMVGAAPRRIARFGPNTMTVLGLGTLALGLAWLSLFRADGSFDFDVLPTLVAVAGMVMAFIPPLGMAMSSAAPEEGGLASGLISTSYQIGSALALAAMTAVAAAVRSSGGLEALTSGFSAGPRCRRHRRRRRRDRLRLVA